MKRKLVVGIVGGNGKMGGFFKRFFEKNGFKVLVSSRSTKLNPIGCASQSDIVIVSVPINATIGVIKKIGPHIKKGSLLMDTTSIKKGPVDAMLRHSVCEVIGMHPVFGPSTSSLKNQSIVLCPARGKIWLNLIAGIFRKSGAKIKISNSEKHDEMMSIIQGLSHFNTLSMAHAMKRLGIKIDDSLKYSSPIFKLKAAVIGRLLNQDPKLYADMQILNPKNKKILRIYADSAKKLEKIIRQKNSREFLKFFDECAEFFGTFRKKGEKISNRLVEEVIR